MARRLAAGIEVLVIPATRRTINATFLPVHFDDLVFVAAFVGPGSKLFRPEQYIARRSKPQQSGARAMIVSLVITTDRPLGNVADQTITGGFELSQLHAFSLFISLIDNRRTDIRNEIGIPNVGHADAITLVAYLEIFALPVVAIANEKG